ncbi:MAG: peptidoglycan-associated lipoprotein Pal [Myxococcota bacterium]|nr:peptidoglycan-associated lipoprotein Pal [Myxococcota bacterium]
MARASMVRWCGLAAGLLLAGAVGCQSSKTSQTQTTSTPTGSEFDQGAVEPSPGPASSRPELKSVYFDYDRSEIRPDARSTLSTNAQAIQGNKDWGVVTVEGHCDERGSEEYNLALGDRRANAVKRYLVDLGVPSGRLRTVSFGEARPAVPGHDESAWRYNRRSEFRGGS